MLDKLIIPVALFVILASYVSPANAWVIFHKPEFKGRVIDAETKKPIEGAVVVAIYSKKSIRWAPESVSINIKVREGLTNIDGMFRIPAYTTIIDPLSWSKEVAFVIFKPGYGRFPDQRIQPPQGIDGSLEDYFSKDFGMEKEILVKEPWVLEAKYKNEKVIFGVVALPKLKTREERLRSTPGHDDNTPILNRLIDEQDKTLGIK